LKSLLAQIVILVPGLTGSNVLECSAASHHQYNLPLIVMRTPAYFHCANRNRSGIFPSHPRRRERRQATGPFQRENPAQRRLAEGRDIFAAPLRSHLLRVLLLLLLLKDRVKHALLYLRLKLAAGDVDVGIRAVLLHFWVLLQHPELGWMIS